MSIRWSVLAVACLLSLGVRTAGADDASLRLLVRGVEEAGEHDAEPPAGSPAARLKLLHARLQDPSLTARERGEIEREVKDLLEQQARTARDGGEDEPTLGPVEGPHDEASYYDVFRSFYELDVARRDGHSPDAEIWERLASRCNAYCRVLDPEALARVAPYLLRLRLLQAESLLFASVQRHAAGERDAQLADHRLGIRLLELLYKVDPEAVGPLPRPSDPANEVYYYNAGVMDYDPGGNKGWFSVRAMADRLLADFCPWGVQVYLLLEETGLAAGLDWRILPPYGAPEVTEVGPLVVMPASAVPAHVRDDAADIADGRFHAYVDGGGGKTAYREVAIDWRQAPAVRHGICFLSPQAFGLTPSQKIDLGWKAFVLVTAGPLALVGDYAQDRLVAELGSLVQGRGEAWRELHAAVALANTADNFGFDKSWLFELKPELKPAKLAKSLLVQVLQMDEGVPLKDLFSGLAPEHELLQANAEDPRTYDGRAMAHVILRTDVHGFEKTAADEYPRMWNVLRFYQLAPRVLAGSGRYDLGADAATTLPNRAAYLSGDEGVLLNTWRPLPFDAETPYGFRRRLIDFTPPVQLLRVEIPEDVLASWRRGLKDGEELAALLLHAGTEEPLLDSLCTVPGTELSWRIDDVRLRDLHRQLALDTPMDGMPDGAPVDLDHVAGTCYADRLKARYDVRVVRCRRDGAELSWRKPLKRLAALEAVFWSREGEASGDLTQPRSGVHELKMVYDGPRAQVRLPDLPFTRVEVNVKLRGRTGTAEGSASRSLTFRMDGVGRFQGTGFRGTFQDAKRKSSVSVVTGPRRFDALGTLFPEQIASFTASLHEKPKDGESKTLSVSGANLVLDPRSPLLETGVPFHEFMRNERLRRRYGYAFLQYRVEGEVATRVLRAEYEHRLERKDETVSERLQEVEEAAYLVVTLWFY